MKTQKLSYMIVALSMTITFLSSCGKNNDSGPGTGYPNGTAAVTGVQLTDNAKFGKILTDNNGNSLYFFANDVAGKNTCVNGCAIIWPIFYKKNPAIGTGLNPADFGELTTAAGPQTTYKGWPLYYYQQDAKPGDTNGDGVNKIWAVAKADYTVMFGNQQLTGLDNVQYNDQGVAGTGASQFLTTPDGQTLYLFSPDTKNVDTFLTGDPIHDAIWPIFISTGSPIVVPSIIDKSLFGTADTKNTQGKTQLTYKGHPMYTFSMDAGVRGNTKGVSFPKPGMGVWKVLNNNTTAL